MGKDTSIAKLTGNPYDDAIRYITIWCERNHYEDMIVTLQLDEVWVNEVLLFNGNDVSWEWCSDWWEGQKNVHLIRFCPLSLIHPLIGRPQDE